MEGTVKRSKSVPLMPLLLWVMFGSVLPSRADGQSVGNDRWFPE